MKLRIKLPRIVVLGIVLKIIISGLLLGVFWELKRNADMLSPSHQAAFNELQNSIATLENKVTDYVTQAQPPQRDLAKEELLVKNMEAIKLAYRALDNISRGEGFDLAALRDFVSSDEWSQLAAAQEKIAGTDESLAQELNLCLRYIATEDNGGQTQPEKSILDKMVRVEETKTYNQDVQIKAAIANAEGSIQHSHYDMAMHYLNGMPEDAAINSCIHGVKSAVQARIAVKDILLSLQRRIIDDK